MGTGKKLLSSTDEPVPELHLPPFRSCILPLSSEPNTVILPNATLVICNIAQRKIKPHVFWVDSGCAPFFDIVDIRIGVESQPVSYGAIPASMFALRRVKIEGENGTLEEAITPGYLVQWPVVQLGQCISIHVHNISDTPRRFRAALECFGQV